MYGELNRVAIYKDCLKAATLYIYKLCKDITFLTLAHDWIPHEWYKQEIQDPGWHLPATMYVFYTKLFVWLDMLILCYIMTVNITKYSLAGITYKLV